MLQSSHWPAGAEPNLYWGAYAAQAAELLLDAVARSDGTRFRWRTGSSRLEPRTGYSVIFASTKTATLVPSPITIVRVSPRGEGMSRNATDFADGAIVQTVIRPPTPLVQEGS